MFHFSLNGKEGVEKALSDLADIGKLETAMNTACLEVERTAKEKAPANTGNLRASIQSEVNTGTNSVEGKVFSPLVYAPYIEYGTGLFAASGGRKDVPWHYQSADGEWHSTNGQHPQPFLIPALDEKRSDILSMLEACYTNG